MATISGRLRELKLEVTYRCPLACIHCSSDGRPNQILEMDSSQLVGKRPLPSAIHLDPGLDAHARLRPEGWLPAFGQVRAAQSHLAQEGVGVGDLFLFFGWFRETEKNGDTYRYRRDAPDIHGLFGWLQIGAIYRPGVVNQSPPPWADSHPHVANASSYLSEGSNNTLYVAAERLDLPGLDHPVAGGGAFRNFDARMRLTASGSRLRSTWRLPSSFRPASGSPALSYHRNPKRWSEDADGLLLKTVGRGQEFVLDCDGYPGVYDWLAEVLALA